MERKTFEDSLLDPLEWMKKDKEEVERLLGPETAAMVGFDQRTPHHCHTLFELVAVTRSSVVRDIRILVHRCSDSVTSKFSYYSVAETFAVFLDCMADITCSHSDLCIFKADPERLLGTLDKIFDFGSYLADHVCSACI